MIEAQFLQAKKVKDLNTSDSLAGFSEKGVISHNNLIWLLVDCHE